MRIFSEDCPYCGTKSVAFTISDERKVSKPSTWDTFAHCGHCGRGIVATFHVIDTRDLPPSEAAARLLSIAPKNRSAAAPEHTPNNVARFFEQAMDNLPKNWDAAGGMFRKALDTGLKRRFSKIEGSLHDRIKEAAEKQMLTPEMAEWAHQIRLDGNDAAHDEVPFSEDDAKKLAQFTQLVFLYLFTLPGMLKEAQEKTRKDG